MPSLRQDQLLQLLLWTVLYDAGPAQRKGEVLPTLEIYLYPLDRGDPNVNALTSFLLNCVASVKCVGNVVDIRQLVARHQRAELVTPARFGLHDAGLAALLV